MPDGYKFMHVFFLTASSVALTHYTHRLVCVLHIKVLRVHSGNSECRNFMLAVF